MCHNTHSPWKHNRHCSIDSSPLLFCPQSPLPCEAAPLWSSWLQKMGIFQKKTEPNLPFVKKKGLFLLFVSSLFCSCISTFELRSYPEQRRKKKLYLKMGHSPEEHDINAPQLLLTENCGSCFRLITWGREALSDLLTGFMGMFDGNHFCLSTCHSTSLLLPVTSCLFINMMPPLWLKMGPVMRSTCICFALFVQWFLLTRELWRESPPHPRALERGSPLPLVHRFLL